ncbi:MAG: Inner membrane protein YejM [Candidatus Anoxychlamydiales bacterium]|nr:Inner membrane protein YejM [Candidatus Anoxychlamydiales bacterium]
MGALFTLYSFFQASVAILFMSFILDKIKPKIINQIFITLCFLLLIAYMINFIVTGLLDQSLIFVINILFSGGLHNLFVAFRAINLNLSMYIVLFLILSLLPAFGIFLYHLTNKFCKKRALFFKNKHMFSFLIFSILSIFLIDCSCRYKNFDHISKNQKKLPLGLCFLSNKKKQIYLPKNLKPILDEEKTFAKIDKKNLQIEKRPNIFIFITEALRKDYITHEIAPNLFSFGEKNISFEKAYSASNTTMVSWYSIFHSNHPIHWTNAKESLTHGSLPLNILKKAGYKINVFSSAELKYFNLDELIFGKNLSLIDNLNDFSTIATTPANRDYMTISALTNSLNDPKNKDSNVFIVFLDSTHSEYSWRDDFKPKFTPYLETINYVTMSQSRANLDLLKNRYKNAINYIDHLFGTFINNLKMNNLYDDSLIVFAADHGEEFFDQGALFHASHLHESQLKIPIIYKLNSDKKASNITTHIDIFPTLLTQIMPNVNFDKYFDGRSIFNVKKSPYIISVNQRGSFTPNEILITKNQTKLLGKLNPSKNSMSFEIEDSQNIDTENLEKELTKALEDVIQ